MKNYLLFLSLILIIRCTNSSQSNLKLESLSMLDNIDSVNSQQQQSYVLTKSEFYLIKGYEADRKTDEYIDSIINRKIILNKTLYDNYNIVFYKESSQTNIENIRKNPRVIDRYSQDHDMIYRVSSSHGKLISKFKIENGKIANQKEIFVTNPSNSK